MQNNLTRMDLVTNPFDPTGAGMPVSGELWMPQEREAGIREAINEVKGSHGAKVITIVGGYGSGKTCVLRWIQEKIFPSEKIESFYFDNPGVQFYDLANMLLRTIGRKDFAKLIWELAGSYVERGYQKPLFSESYEAYIYSSTSRNSIGIAEDLQQAIGKSGVTSDEEVAYRLAKMVIDLPKNPYFKYQDFTSSGSGSLVAKGQEVEYFNAILKTIRIGKNAEGVAFLIDEFEEIGLEKVLSKRSAHGYLATLKRLINMAQGESSNFWLILSMTEDAYDKTIELEPALQQRFYNKINTKTLNHGEAKSLIYSRLSSARVLDAKRPEGDIFPFPEELPFSDETCSIPRRLVKVCFRAIENAEDDASLPFDNGYLKDVESDLYNDIVE